MLLHWYVVMIAACRRIRADAVAKVPGVLEAELTEQTLCWRMWTWCWTLGPQHTLMAVSSQQLLKKFWWAELQQHQHGFSGLNPEPSVFYILALTASRDQLWRLETIGCHWFGDEMVSSWIQGHVFQFTPLSGRQSAFHSKTIHLANCISPGGQLWGFTCHD